MVVTSEKGDTVLWGEPGQEVVERQVIWGAGSTDLLEEGIDWADAGNTTGRLTLPQPSSASQRVFLAAKNADGSSRGMERVKCKLMSRDVPDVSLVLANASSTTLELNIRLGLCSDKEDENLLLQKATLTICRSGAICEKSSLHHSNSISVTNLPSSTCFCIGLNVQTMLGNASLATSPSSTCSYCTGITVNDILQLKHIHVYINFAAPVSSPTILEAALVQGPDEDNQTPLLLLNLKNSTFPKEAASTCHIRVTSSASLIQMPCHELLLVSLPPGNLCNNIIMILSLNDDNNKNNDIINTMMIMIII